MYVFNQLTSSLLELDSTLYEALKRNDTDSIPQDVKAELAKSSIMLDDDLCEEKVVLLQNMHAKYSGSSARVTIMPTLNCNFSCWYCYEHHHESVMSDECIVSALAFCEKLIGSGVKHFQLDWFGGEPLLYFNDIVYPMSLKIMRMCEKRGVEFMHSITTNGYLIDDDVIEKMKEVGLASFQITLDGGPRYHNRTRFAKTDRETFATIVGNITKLCRAVDGIDMTVRINYTPHNICSLGDIASVFPEDVRNRISVCPQLVWQFKNGINATTDKIRDILALFKAKGYRPHINRLCSYPCYAENMSQFVINYDLSVFKCTARDFNHKYSVGCISDGEFIPNANYFNYVSPPDYLSGKCKECEMLPSCLCRCVQKRVEGQDFHCDKDGIRQSLINDISLYMNLPN